MIYAHKFSRLVGVWSHATVLMGLLVVASGCSEQAAESPALQYQHYAEAPTSPVAELQPMPEIAAQMDVPPEPQLAPGRQFNPQAYATKTSEPIAIPQEIALPSKAFRASEPTASASDDIAATGGAASGKQSPVAGEHLDPLPSGAEHDAEAGFATVEVFYATDRLRTEVSLAAGATDGQKSLLMLFVGVAVLLGLMGMFQLAKGRSRAGVFAMVVSCLLGVLSAGWLAMGQGDIEKQGVTYNGDRGTLVRGICEVTVPDTHQRGLVERPSLLRFELHEDQTKHLVLTSATELPEADFKKRLATRVASAPEADLLVFIHGYNVDFESAVQRTAQIAVDLPFEGVPVCYSWPSQGSLVGYTVDENNSEWTITHLQQFLLELVDESGAKSINVVAHSMGNRAMTAAMQQIGWQLDSEAAAPFDRIVLAAPDVDADRFKRDLAPSLLRVANQVTLYASSDDQALIASKQVHGYPRAGESGPQIVVVPGIETIDVSGIDLSLLGHSYYGDNETMLRDLYELVRQRLPAPQRAMLTARQAGKLIYWQLAQQQDRTLH